MKMYIKLISAMGLFLVLVGCASQGNYSASQKAKKAEASPLIAYAPAIDLSYKEVTEDINGNIGVNVRWGGQIIQTEQVNETTSRLTVFAYPLTPNGRPIQSGQASTDSGRFIVELKDGLANDISFDGHLVTFYGGISDKKTLTNGNKQKTIPVISAVELIDWDIVDREKVASKRRGNAFYSLGYRTGHFYSRGRYGYGNPYFNYSRYGHRSRHSSYYGYGYRSSYYGRYGGY